IQASVDRESVVEELQEEHHDLQRVHATAIRHTRDLHTRLSQAGSAAQHFIQFCQERHDAIVRELGVTSASLTDERVSVQRLEAELASVASIREEHRRLQVSSAVADRRSQRQIKILERQVVDLRSQLTALTGHPDLVSAPPPALARRLQAQDREVRSSRERIATLERSEKALEDATAQLRRQAEAGNRRLARLREECGEYQQRLESLRDERDQATTQLRGTRERLTKTRSELQSQAEHITSMRSSMSRLEGQVAQWRGANAESQATLTELTAETELLRQDQDRLSRVYNELRDHYAEAYTRFSAVASAMGQTVTLPPPSNFVQAEPRERRRPTPTPPLPSSIHDRPAGSSPSTRAHKTARTPLSSSAPRDTTSSDQALPTSSPQPSTGANNNLVDSTATARSESSFISPTAAQGMLDLGGTSSRSVEHNARDSDLFGSEDDEEDPNYLAALARSRAELRRSHSHEEHRTDLVRRLPAAPNPDDDGSSSSTANSSSDHFGRGSQLGSSPDASSDGEDDSLSEIDNSRAQNYGAAASARPSSTSQRLIPATTTIPRLQWIPGYERVRRFRAGDVIPWDAHILSSLTVGTISASILKGLLDNVAEWLYPDRIPVPNHDYERLITGDAVQEIMSADPPPWAVLDTSEIPLTFSPNFMIPEFVEKYLVFEDRHMQALWESLHFLPISTVMCRRDPKLPTYHEGRRQRRSRAGEAWTRYLRVVMQVLRLRRCDLDILLDPFFMHLPKSRKPKEWYPRVENDGDTLADALVIVDREDPWRNHYRDRPAEHPSMQIARLRDKFVPPQNRRAF
ncbi:hypothetical protein F444_02608, partial [Phytophthora nicotianae P1976]